MGKNDFCETKFLLHVRVQTKRVIFPRFITNKLLKIIKTFNNFFRNNLLKNLSSRKKNIIMYFLRVKRRIHFRVKVEFGGKRCYFATEYLKLILFKMINI